MKNKHTPTPWNNSLTGIKNSRGLLIAQAWCGYENESFGRIPSVTYEEMQANAKLIAAAPELLEALQELTQSFGLTKTVIVSKIQQAAFDKSIAAIKKATL